MKSQKTSSPQPQAVERKNKNPQQDNSKTHLAGNESEKKDKKIKKSP